MCGIAGIFNYQPADESIFQRIHRMVGSILHRGPDEQGIYLDDQVALGHARLSIIDIGGGTQPIRNEDGSIWVVYNGEVFNFPELRTDLESRGHRFYTKTDTEVIVHLYEEYGVACFERLIGQFAIAIWDISTRHMILARDRVGIRPLFYTRQSETVIFASEVKALASSGLVSLAIDPRVLSQVFTFWTPFPGNSIFENIHEVPPGCYAILNDKSMEVHRYWEWPVPGPDDIYKGSRDELAEQLSYTLEDAIRIRMRADVPVGCYLSGGLDSSGISAITCSRFKPDLHTFGIRFNDAAYDEGEFQDAVVSWLKLDHTALHVTDEDIGQAFLECIRHLEQPVLRTAPAPLFLLSRKVQNAGYKVVLTGEGADEVFGGYNIFKETKARRFWSKYPDSQCRPLLLKKLYPYVFKDPRMARMNQAFFAQGLTDADSSFFSHDLRWKEANQRCNLFSAHLREESKTYDPRNELIDFLPKGFDETDWLNKAQALEASLFMSQYLLSAQGDRPAMAHSLEVRLPYLDHRLIELAATIPLHWKIRGMNEKCILKEILTPWLPSIVSKREKHPYRAPAQNPLLSNELIKENLTTQSLDAAGLFDSGKVSHLMNKMSSTNNPSERDTMAFVAVASTQLLYHQFVEQQFDDIPNFEFDLLVDRRTSATRQPA